jgi:hypothetical protein
MAGGERWPRRSNGSVIVGGMLTGLFLASVVIIFTGHDSHGWQPWPGVAMTALFAIALIVWWHRA